MHRSVLLAAMAAALMLSACASEPMRPLPGARHPRSEYHPSRELMRKYDTNGDGSVTTAEFNAGLRADFNAADTDRDGVLNLTETRAVNQARIAELGTAASPLIDWNQDGHVDFTEFAAGPRALFIELDRDENGILDETELRPRRNGPPPRPRMDLPMIRPGG